MRLLGMRFTHHDKFLFVVGGLEVKFVQPTYYDWTIFRLGLSSHRNIYSLYSNTLSWAKFALTKIHNNKVLMGVFYTYPWPEFTLGLF